MPGKGWDEEMAGYADCTVPVGRRLFRIMNREPCGDPFILREDRKVHGDLESTDRPSFQTAREPTRIGQLLPCIEHARPRVSRP